MSRARDDGAGGDLDATTLPDRDEIKLAIASVYEALVEAFSDLRELHRIEGNESIPGTERQGKYSASSTPGSIGI